MKIKFLSQIKKVKKLVKFNHKMVIEIKSYYLDISGIII